MFVKYDLLTEYLTLFWLSNLLIDKCKSVFEFKKQCERCEMWKLTSVGPTCYQQNWYAEGTVNYSSCKIVQLTALLKKLLKNPVLELI